MNDGMTKIRHIVALLLALALYGCQGETFTEVEQPPSAGDTFTVSGSIALPDMPTATTRGALADTPHEGLKLTLVEFD